MSIKVIFEKCKLMLDEKTYNQIEFEKSFLKDLMNIGDDEHKVVDGRKGIKNLAGFSDP